MLYGAVRTSAFSMFVVVFILAVAFAKAEPSCEPIRVEMCMGLGYNVTGMRQNDAVMTLQTFQPLIEYGCSAQLKFFLCSVFVPMCTDKVLNPIGPCRGLCERVRSRCHPVLSGFGFPWPDALNCSLFPEVNNQDHMCMEGPSEVGGGISAVSSLPSTPAPCAHLARHSHYAYVNRSGKCVPLCNADVLFDSADKNLSEVWLSIWAALCFLSTVVALLTFVVDTSEWGRYPEKPFMFVALCYVLVSVGWAVRSAAGRSAVACKLDASAPARLLLTDDGFGNAYCAIVFLFIYYFGMAASVWWVVGCGCWLASGGLRWTQDRLQGLSTWLHLAAWGIPAVHTVTVIVRRDVDADELTGTCFVGAQNLVSLLWLVLVPHTVCLCIGVALLVGGVTLMWKRPNGTQPRPALPLPTVRARPKHPTDLLKLGVFGVLYTIPLGCLVSSYAYEYFNREKWLTGVSKPALWIFLLRILMSLVVGITSAMWVWTPRTVAVWKQYLGRLFPRPAYHQPPVKCQQPLPVLRYATTQPPQHNGSALTQSLTGAPSVTNTIPPYSDRHSTRSHKHRSSSRAMPHHYRNGGETIL